MNVKKTEYFKYICKAQCKLSRQVDIWRAKKKTLYQAVDSNHELVDKTIASFLRLTLMKLETMLSISEWMGIESVTDCNKKSLVTPQPLILQSQLYELLQL